MKKILLLTLAAAASAPSFSQTQPTVIDRFVTHQMSPNGEWLIGRSNTWYDEEDDTYLTETSIVEVATGKIYGTGDLFSLPSFSCPISNSGVAVMSTYNAETNGYEAPYILVPGEEPILLEQFYTTGPYAGKECYTMAITPDASAFLGYYEQYPRQYPFVCAINPDLTVGEPDYLPLPKDINGLEPFAVMLAAMSDDAKTVVGTVTDNSGKLSYPIIYKLGEDGKWSWTCPTASLYDPENPNLFPNFYSYQVAVSPDGSKMVCTQEVPGAIPNFPDYKIWVINTQTFATESLDFSNPDVIATQILDDGTIVGTFFATIKVSYIMLPGSNEFIDFVKYANNVNPAFGEWMEENLMVEVLDYDTDGNLVPMIMPDTGQVFVSTDLSVFGAGLQSLDANYNAVYTSYVFTDNQSSGIGTPEKTSQKEEILNVYNLQGVKVLSTRNSADVNALPSGIYIVNGKKIRI